MSSSAILAGGSTVPISSARVGPRDPGNASGNFFLSCALTVPKLSSSTPCLVVDLSHLSHFLFSDDDDQPGLSGLVTGFLVHGAGPGECTLAHSS